MKVYGTNLKYNIRHDYRASRSSGSVPASRKVHIVVHDMEVTAYNTAAEAVGSYFSQRSAKGSTQAGVDNDSIQQYLPWTAIPWGAPYLNTTGLHIEMMGAASWTQAQWLLKAPGTIDRTAWLIAFLAKEFDIPIRKITDSQLRNGAPGVTTHRQATRAYHIYGGHTDPGSGFPWDELLERARAYRMAMDAPKIVPLKKLMLAYAKKQELKIPDDFAVNDEWGPGAQTLAWRVSGHLKIKQTSHPTPELSIALLRRG